MRFPIKRHLTSPVEYVYRTLSFCCCSFFPSPQETIAEALKGHVPRLSRRVFCLAATKQSISQSLNPNLFFHYLRPIVHFGFASTLFTAKTICFLLLLP